MLGVVVDRLIRLLDDQDRGVVQVGPGQGDPELFVRLEVVAELADDRVVAVGQSWMKWWACVTLAASMTRGRVFIGSPRPMLTST